jgi:hypothetical protein
MVMSDGDRDPDTERENKGDEVSERLAQRLGDESKRSKSDKTVKSGQTAQSDTSSETAESSQSVKDRPSVLMYLPEELRRELDVRFDELNARHKREHGAALGKNEDYYPAVIQAGLEGKDVEDLLEL